jgi:hypothetical protein
MSSETFLKAAEAAELTGKSLVTIRSYITKGKLPNATAISNGKSKVWQIPLTDLVAAGLLDKVSGTPGAESSKSKTTALDSRVIELEIELRLTRELLARADLELESYRQRERQLFLSIETRDRQEERRFSWFRRNS